MDLLDHVDLLDPQEDLVSVELLVFLDQVDLVVLLDHLDLRADLDRLVEMDYLDHLDQLDLLV